MHKTDLNNPSAQSATQALRQKAETLVSGKQVLSKESLADMSPTLVLKKLHELQVHQIELEMQNETLRQTQLQLGEMRARYFDLYDLAPISYCTVSEAGLIVEANLAAADLLGEVRSKLVGQPISRYISKDYQDSYYLSRKLLLADGERRECELHITRPDGVELWVQMNITVLKNSHGESLQYMVLTDITSTKVLALAIQESEQKLRGLVDSHHLKLVPR